MDLEQKATVLWGVFRERPDDRFDNLEMIADRRVPTDLVVAGQLQRHKVEGTRAAQKALLDFKGAATPATVSQGLADPAGILDQRMDGPMGPVTRMKQPSERDIGQVIGQIDKRIGEEAVAEWRMGRHHRCGPCQRLDLGGLIGKQRRARHAVWLDGQPVGPEVAMFEDMRRYSELARDFNRGRMLGPAVAEHQNVRYCVRLNICAQKGRPFVIAP